MTVETAKLILTIISGVCWTIVYIDGIRVGVRDKSYAIPFYALALNFAWELLYTFFGFRINGVDVQNVFNAVWLTFDIGILYTYFKFGRKYFLGCPPANAGGSDKNYPPAAAGGSYKNYPPATAGGPYKNCPPATAGSDKNYPPATAGGPYKNCPPATAGGPYKNCPPATAGGSDKTFIAWSVLGLVTALAIEYSFIREFGVAKGAGYSAFLQNLLMSILFIAMLARRRSREGQSLLIAVSKWIGTLAPTIVYGILGQGGFPRGSWLILTAGVFCSGFDLIYIGLILKTKPTHA